MFLHAIELFLLVQKHIYNIEVGKGTVLSVDAESGSPFPSFV